MTTNSDEVPVEAIVAARNALADEYINKKMALETPSLITWWHKKRTEKIIKKIGRYLLQLDAWIKEIKK